MLFYRFLKAATLKSNILGFMLAKTLALTL